MKLGDWLVSQGISQGQFAATIDVHRTYLNILVNARRKPGKKTARAISLATGGAVTEEDLLSGAAAGYSSNLRLSRPAGGMESKKLSLL